MVMLLLGVGHSVAQDIDAVLSAVNQNNTGLVAARKLTDAQQIGYHTSLYPQNPEVEFNYLWGNPAVIGNRTDISATQTFDFPTAYYFRGKIADTRGEQAELEYLKQRNTILLQARMLYVELVSTNILAAELQRRLSHAQSLALAWKAKFALNECSILEYNKAQMNQLTYEKQSGLLELNRLSLQSELNALNGGQAITVTDTVYPPVIISADFEQWYSQAEQKSPMLQWLKKEVELSRIQIKLNTASSLPKLSTGYLSERVAGESFQGLMVGISIPLWENRNTVRYAKAYAVAAESAEADQRLVFYNQLKAQHALVLGLQKQVVDYSTTMNAYNNADLLRKSFDGGELSLIEYLLELSLYYENFSAYFSAEKEMQLQLALLQQYVY